MNLADRQANRIFWPAIAVTVTILTLAGCAGAGEGALKGAGGGALSGAASGLVSSLIWGGDPGEYMVRGAQVGATMGAIGGAVEGSNRTRAEQDRAAAQEQQQIDQIRHDIGNEAFDGIVALAECKQELAIANANEATNSENSNHALAGLWVAALSYADQDDSDKLNGIVPELVRWDRGMDTEADVRKELDTSYAELLNIRAEYQLPLNCDS